MAKIQLMPPELANMIAAGEVIERPSSVIKELVENSIDANASHIDIQIFSYGKELISVKDDGCGMGREDAIMAFKRHATSKVKSIYDLMRITTLGFRGEAIPSIASVSHVSMFTSDGAEVGTSIVSEPGAELKIQDASLRKGTLFEIRELFYNTPARLKFLKEERTENLSSIETVQHLAIGFPEIAFSLFIDGKKSFSTTGRGSLLETIACIYGNDIAKKCLPFHISTVSYSADGFIVHPSISYSSKYDILTFMNNRSVYIPRVQKAIIDGYRDYLPPTRYPMAIIPIKVDYALVDVNVHPTKKEVRLSCEINLANDIHKQVQIVLASTRGEFDDAKMKTENNSVTRSGDGNVSPFLSFTNTHFDGDRGTQPIDNDKVASAAAEGFNAGQVLIDVDTTGSQGEGTFSVSDSHGYVENSGNDAFGVFEQQSSFPEIFPIGQVLETYIVCDSADGLYLVDQHAAAERINFEKCEEWFKTKKDLVIPLFPVVVDLTPALKNNYDEQHIKALEALGIRTSAFGPSSIKLDEIPQYLADKDDDSVLRDIINETLKGDKVDVNSIERLAIATKACKMSIKANMILDHASQVSLLQQLSKCHNPLNCPHGRPTIIKISKSDIEKLFKRTGF